MVSLKCIFSDERKIDFFFKTGKDEGRTSRNPCSVSYAGRAPFSDVETRTYAKFLTSLKDKMMAYISFHSYSQLLLFPYGHTREHLENYDELVKIKIYNLKTKI